MYRTVPQRLGQPTPITHYPNSLERLHALLLGAKDIEELAQFCGVEYVHDLRANLAELECSLFLTHFFAQHEHDAKHGTG